MGIESVDSIDSSKTNDYYQEFNKFQTYFYTDVIRFDNYSNYDIKKHAFVLLNNIAKGFPDLADTIGNLYSPIVKAIQSPAIIKALQHRFVNPYSHCRVPQFIYYKSLPKTKEKTGTKSKKKIDKSNIITGIDFDVSVQQEIQSILFIDNKDFESLKYTDKVQFLGKQILGEIREETKSEKKVDEKKPNNKPRKKKL